MKRKNLIIVLFILFIFVFFPVYSFTDWDPQKTIAIYFYNKYAQFMPKDVNAMGVEISTYFNERGYFVWFLGISQENIAIEKIKKMSKVYVILEYTGDIVSVSGNKGDYKITIEMDIKGTNLNNENKKFSDTLEYEGDSMPDLSNARSLALQQTGIEITDKNFDKILSLFDK